MPTLDAMLNLFVDHPLGSAIGILIASIIVALGLVAIRDLRKIGDTP